MSATSGAFTGFRVGWSRGTNLSKDVRWQMK
jgi:hypothetical protein